MPYQNLKSRITLGEVVVFRQWDGKYVGVKYFHIGIVYQDADI
jgi:hypothetical protein